MRQKILIQTAHSNGVPQDLYGYDEIATARIKAWTATLREVDTNLTIDANYVEQKWLEDFDLVWKASFEHFISIYAVGGSVQNHKGRIQACDLQFYARILEKNMVLTWLGPVLVWHERGTSVSVLRKIMKTIYAGFPQN